jgi:DNA primase
MSERERRLKAAVDITSVIAESLPLERAGDDFLGRCPFCSGRLWVYPKAQIYQCHNCAHTGDVITFLMQIKGLPYGRALDLLAQLRLELVEPEAGVIQ